MDKPNKRDLVKDALMMFKNLTQNSVKKFKKTDIRPGTMVSFSYIAKDKNKPWDITPLVLVLWRTKGYTLGLNFHWVPKRVRYILLDYIFKTNRANIEQGKPLVIDYKHIKPLLIKLKLMAVVRLYINKRMSKRGIIIPNEHMRKAIELPSENFIGVSAEQAYSYMVKSSRLKPKPKPKPKKVEDKPKPKPKKKDKGK
jgi:hypothetical protein